MPEKFKKPYDPAATEPRIYDVWEKSGAFAPKGDGTPYTVMMPPPNATGILHMGHALGITIQDILVRFKRMQGYAALYLPGTDHAAIATQAKVEREISKKESKNRYEIGREELVKRIDQFVSESRGIIRSQVRVLGASCDWSREAFTLDAPRNRAVNAIFKMMYDAGLIYRGHRIVNWDSKGQTTISDDEIIYQEEKTAFYYFKYGPFVIGTARPETKFGDKYVVVHPADSRYGAYTHGQKIELEWINGPTIATVIKDASIDMEFGTGAMTITPWHSSVDFDIAERYELDREQIIDERGKLLPIAGEFTGMKIAEARPKIVEKLRNKGLLVKEEAYTHNLATAERTGGIIEPQIKLQWFVDVEREVPGRGKNLKQLMREAVESGRIAVIPEHFAKTYFHWIDNLRPWCISRQIWYGHRIPVWYKGEHIAVGEAPEGEGWAQDEDTLDTWFSSGTWTFSTLGWPDESPDLKRFHPTDSLVTAYEIIFFWVARMILMSEFALKDVPFRSVYLTGIIRDAKGQKFSKSLGNGIDPVEVAKRYGADAGRMALVVGNTPGTDMRLSDDKIKAYKHFANKLWNIARFILENSSPEATIHGPLRAEDQTLLDACTALAKDVSIDLEEFRFYLASEKLYHYIWHELADKILEESKLFLQGKDEAAKRSRTQLLLMLLDRVVRLLHPFMPFITEEIYQSFPTKDSPLLMTAQWPI